MNYTLNEWYDDDWKKFFILPLYFFWIFSPFSQSFFPLLSLSICLSCTNFIVEAHLCYATVEYTLKIVSWKFQTQTYYFLSLWANGQPQSNHQHLYTKQEVLLLELIDLQVFLKANNQPSFILSPQMISPWLWYIVRCQHWTLILLVIKVSLNLSLYNLSFGIEQMYVCCSICSNLFQWSILQFRLKIDGFAITYSNCNFNILFGVLQLFH